MSAKPRKSKDAATESIATQQVDSRSIVNARNKDPAKKSATARLRDVTDPKSTAVTDVPDENELKSSAKKRKHDKKKVIRDSFSFPEQDYLKISALKQLCLSEGIHVKKGELLRAGLHLLAKLDLAELKQAVEQVEKVKTGRPNA